MLILQPHELAGCRLVALSLLHTTPRMICTGRNQCKRAV